MVIRIGSMLFRRSTMIGCTMSTALLIHEANKPKFISSMDTAPERSKCDPILMSHKTDRYNGIIINDPLNFPSTPAEFNDKMERSISKWKLEKKRGVWLTIPPEKIGFAAHAVKHGFEVHSADKKQGLIMTRWLPDTPNTLPSPASHYVGVGCLLLNEDKTEMLVVQEKNGILRGKGFWKIPTGTVENGEDLPRACARELLEETGIEATAKSCVLFRHATQYLNNKGDVFLIFLMELDDPENCRIRIQESEIAACEWIPLETYFQQDTSALFPAGREAYRVMNQSIKAAIEDESRGWAISHYNLLNNDRSAIYHPRQQHSSQ